MPVLIAHSRPFVADHFHDLPGFQEDRHGHNWEVRATVHSAGNDDVAQLDGALDAWIREVDYTLLNQQESLERRNPTTELLAQWAYESLERAGLRPEAVKVREKANYWACCRREGRGGSR